MPRILAIDYGTKRVGIAVTDPLQIVANALTTVESHKAIDFLKSYLQKEIVETIVVGLPTRMDGSDTHATLPTENFVNLLRKTFPTVPIERMDERFTSAMAKRSMIEMGMKKKDRQKKTNIDQMSAAIILQSYMESKNLT
jgi:putative Holliday junction resolvase